MLCMHVVPHGEFRVNKRWLIRLDETFACCQLRDTCSRSDEIYATSSTSPIIQASSPVLCFPQLLRSLLRKVRSSLANNVQYSIFVKLLISWSFSSKQKHRFELEQNSKGQ